MSAPRAQATADAWLERMARENAGPAPTTPRAPTFQDIGERWTSGELARLYPDHVKAKGTAEADRRRLESYVYPIVRGVPIVDFTLEHAERVMHMLPAKRVRTAATRRHVAQIVHRVLALAVFPLRILKVHPLPPGFRPKIGPPKAKGYLFPDEDAALLKCTAVPLCWRVLYGFLDREGCRVSEATALDLATADLRRGVVVLDENKTDDPRAGALGPDVVRALRAWVAHREATAGAPLPPSAPLFVDEDGKPIGEASLAAQLREHLQAAGVDRASLFQHNETRLRIRAHDLRATFVTLALANGRTETWVADRTGHKTSDMINRYRRAARTAAELGLGWLAPLDTAIPELAGAAGDDGANGAPDEGGESGEKGDGRRTQARTHAGLDVAKRGVDDAGSIGKHSVSRPDGAVFESPNRGSNPCAGTEDGAEGRGALARERHP
jgi:integrase